MGEAKRKKEQYRKNPRPCVFCGAADGTTKDHVPPKGIFVNPRPQLITVPACARCNNRTSQLDEEFKIFLSLKVGVDTPSSRAFWREGALASIQNNQRIMRKILGGERVALPDPNGAPQNR